MSFTWLYIMHIWIRCNFRLEAYNWNTNHSPTMVTSRQPTNVPTPNHSFTHSPFKCCSKHPNAPTQSRSARNHHRSTKKITKTKTKEIRNKYIYIYIYIKRERERERDILGSWIWRLLINFTNKDSNSAVHDWTTLGDSPNSIFNSPIKN